jgi:hypothetical protein
MRTMTRQAGWLVICLLLWGSPPVTANLYHWTDAQGVRHFSNTPPPDGADATVLLEEIPYDPESDDKRRAQEDAMLRESESAETQKRLENAERDAEEARRQAEAARRKADRLEKELEERDDDPSYGIYYPRRPPPGYRPPGHRPPGHRPPGYRPPGQRPPGQRPPGWRPKPEPYDPTPPKPWQQPRNSGPRGRDPR